MDQVTVAKFKQIDFAIGCLRDALASRNHRKFFILLQRFAQSFAKPILYLHGDGHFWQREYPFMSKHIWRVQVQQGGSANPVTVMVTDDPKEPFVFVRE